MNHIHPKAFISAKADIEISTRGSRCVIGAGSVIDSFVKIKFAGGNADIVIGENVYINSGCVLYSGNGIRIGNNVAIAANCTFASVNHAYASAKELIVEQGFKESKGGIVIEDDVWIGAGSTLCDGSYIETGCVIGAMSLVRQRTVRYGIYAGNPIKIYGFRE